MGVYVLVEGETVNNNNLKRYIILNFKCVIKKMKIDKGKGTSWEVQFH